MFSQFAPASVVSTTKSYIMRRGRALATGADENVALMVDGSVVYRFRQTTTHEADNASYLAALSPPMDAATRRFNKSMAAYTRPRSRRNPRTGARPAAQTSKVQVRQWIAFKAPPSPPKALSEEWRAMHARQVKPEQPRPDGTVVLW